MKCIKGDVFALEAENAASTLLCGGCRLLPKPVFLLDDLEGCFCRRLLKIAGIRKQKLAFRRDEEQRIIARKAAEIAQIDGLAHDHRLDALLLHELAQALDALCRIHRSAPFFKIIRAISSAPK